MTWLAPGAFAALTLLAGPVIVHLLARRNARRLVFPATHFVRPTQAAAVSFRRQSDIGLLLLRLTIVAVAVLAAAHPLVMTPWRLARWNARVSRAVVVDTSRSMPLDGARGTPDASVASRLADQEMRNVFAGRRVNTPDLADGIERAVRWIQAAPPSRREIVLVSDFQRGSIEEDALKTIPADVGIRLIRAGVQPDTRRATSPPVDGWRGGIWQATATIDATGTRASWVRRGSAEVPRWISVMASPVDALAADRALRAVTSFGVPAGDNGRRIVVRFAGADALVPPARAVQSAWIASAALALQRSDLRRAVEPGVTVSERDGVMVVDAPVPAAALAAPAVVRAALLAVRPAAIADAEAEIVTLPDADLARWRRDPAPVTPSAIPVADDSDLSAKAPGRRSSSEGGVAEADARWLWALALVLLAVEARVRHVRDGATQREAHVAAA